MEEHGFFSNSLFDSQVSFAVTWFTNWDEVIQAEAVLKMFDNIKPTQAKFLCSILDERFKEITDPSILEQETAANNHDILKRLMNTEDVDFEKLLYFLPMLKIGNNEAKFVYLTFLPSIISECIVKKFKLEECKKLLSLVILHPAFKDARKQFELFKNQLFNKEEPTESVTASAEASVLKQQSSPDPSISTISSLQSSPRQEKLRIPNQLPQAFSIFTNEGIQVVQTPNRRVHHFWPWNSTGNPTQTGATGSSNSAKVFRPSTNPGMKDLYNWLKFLRLHKYYNHLVGLTYEELLSLNENNFDILVPGVTQGARRKFLLTIAALRQRSSTLVAIEKKVMSMSADSLSICMDEIKKMIFTPMKAAKEEQKMNQDDVPFYLFRVLNTIFNRLIMNNLREEECVKRLRTLIYLVLRNEAFSAFSIVLTTLKNRLYAAERSSSWSMYSSYLQPPTRRMQNFSQYLMIGNNNEYRPPAAAPTMSPLYISIPSPHSSFQFETMNHPQFKSEVIDEQDRELRSDLSLAVGSSTRMSQRTSTSNDSISKSPERISLSSSCSSSNENAFGFDRDNKPIFSPGMDTEKDGLQQSAHGLTLNGESVNEYKLFLDEDNNCNKATSSDWQ